MLKHPAPGAGRLDNVIHESGVEVETGFKGHGRSCRGDANTGKEVIDDFHGGARADASRNMANVLVTAGHGEKGTVDLGESSTVSGANDLSKDVVALRLGADSNERRCLALVHCAQADNTDLDNLKRTAACYEQCLRFCLPGGLSDLRLGVSGK